MPAIVRKMDSFGSPYDSPRVADAKTPAHSYGLASEGEEEDARLDNRIEEALRDPSGRLRLYINNMRCTSLDSKVSRLKGLRELYCQDNSKLTRLPHTLWHIGESLTIIHASRCSLESIPEELAQLRNLRRLSLAGNKLKTFLWDCGPLILVKKVKYPLLGCQDNNSRRPNMNPFSSASSFESAFDMVLQEQFKERGLLVSKKHESAEGRPGPFDASTTSSAPFANANTAAMYPKGQDEKAMGSSMSSSTSNRRGATLGASEVGQDPFGAAALVQTSIRPWETMVKDIPIQLTRNTRADHHQRHVPELTTFAPSAIHDGMQSLSNPLSNTMAAHDAPTITPFDATTRGSRRALVSAETRRTATAAQSNNPLNGFSVTKEFQSFLGDDADEEDIFSTTNPFSWISSVGSSKATSPRPNGHMPTSSSNNVPVVHHISAAPKGVAFLKEEQLVSKLTAKGSDYLKAKTKELDRVVGKVNGIAKRIPPQYIAFASNEHIREEQMSDYLHKRLPTENIVHTHMASPTKKPYQYQFTPELEDDAVAASDLSPSIRSGRLPRITTLNGGATLSRGQTQVRTTTLRGTGALGLSFSKGSGVAANNRPNSPEGMHSVASGNGILRFATGRNVMPNELADTESVSGASRTTGAAGHSPYATGGEPTTYEGNQYPSAPPYCASADETFSNLEFLDLSNNELVFLSPSAIQLVQVLLRKDAWQRLHHSATSIVEPCCLLAPNMHLLSPTSFVLGTMEESLPKPDPHSTYCCLENSPGRQQSQLLSQLSASVSVSALAYHSVPHTASASRLLGLKSIGDTSPNSTHSDRITASVLLLSRSANKLKHASMGTSFNNSSGRITAELARLVFSPSEQHNRILRQFLPSHVDRCIMCGTEVFVEGPTLYVHFVSLTLPTASTAFALQAKETEAIGGRLAAVGRRKSSAQRRHSSFSVQRGANTAPSLELDLTDDEGEGDASEQVVPIMKMAPLRIPCFYPCCSSAKCHIELDARLEKGVDPGHRALEI